MLRYIQLGEHDFISSYNLLLGIAMASGMLYLQFDASFSNLKSKHKDKLHVGLFIAVCFGFLGAVFFDAFTQNIPIKFSYLNTVGLTFLGGFITGLIALSVFFKSQAMPVLRYLNILTPSFCLTHAIGRIGCFMAGCCFGAPTNTPFGVKFPENSLAHLTLHSHVAVHPTQIYESLFVLLVFYVVRQHQVKHKYFVYVLSYLIFRFFIEFIRADNRGSLFNQYMVSPSQMLSIGFLVVTLIMIYIEIKTSSKQASFKA